MSVTSGSPTQIKSYVTTIADLAGLPDDAYDAGDMAFVASVAQTFRLRRTSLGAVPDNVNTVATFTGNGYWEVFGGVPGTMLAVDTIADLALLVDATMGDGQQVFVRSVRSPFTLRTGVVAPDGISIVTALSTTKTWFRTPMPKMWNAQTEFYIDGVAGNDENTGAVNAAIKTLAELSRRTYIPNDPRADFTVHVVGNVTSAAERRFIFQVNANVTFIGALTALHSAIDVTAVTQFKMTAACARQAFTAAGLTFGRKNYLRLSADGGATFHQSGWAVSDKGNPGANQAYTKIYDGAPGGVLATLADTDTAYEYTLFEIEAIFEVHGNVTLEFDTLVVGGTFKQAYGAVFNECVIGRDGRNFYAEQCNLLSFDTCRLGPGDDGGLNGCFLLFYGCPDVQFGSSNLTKGTTVEAIGSNLVWGSESGLVGGDVALYDNSAMRINQDFEHSAASTVTCREPGTAIDVVTGAGQFVWGLTGGNFALQKTNTVMTFEPGSTWTAAGNYAHSDGAGGTTTAALTTLPGAESLAAMPNHSVGVIRRS